MVRYLIERPVAVLMTFTLLVIFGVIALFKLPVSLLPDIDVPEIIIHINYSNTGAKAMEENIVRPMRENLLTLNHLNDIETRSANHTAQVRLLFEYGTRMDLAYIEVNEKLDRMTNQLPKDMPHPRVMRVNTSDVPVIRLQVIPRNPDDFLPVSNLAEKVLKKRIEQLGGVSIVDINGSRSNIIAVTPNYAALEALNLSDTDITAAIEGANRTLGGMSVKDGQYRYFVTVANWLESAEDIARLPLRMKNGLVIPLERVAQVQQETETPLGYHLFNEQESLVITVQKQAGARMNDMIHEIKKVTEQFKKDYPQVDFHLTRDQSFLMNAGIDNLKTGLVIGGLLAIGVLFLFMGNYASPLLMGISIPISLFLTFIFFYLLGLSLNIISLSGLALGIGTLIDNSVIVLDNITNKRREGLSMTDSCVTGTGQVITPVISQVFTTIAVYAPLILLSGLAGALITDQAAALTISLVVSLLVAFCLNPVLYKLFLKRPLNELKEDTRLYTEISRGYHKMIHHIFLRKRFYFSLAVLLMPVGLLLAMRMPISALPDLKQREGLLRLEWNESIDAQENLRRITRLGQAIREDVLITEAEIGISQFLLNQEEADIGQAEFYFLCEDARRLQQVTKQINRWLTSHYPNAKWQVEDAPNAFTQLFTTDEPYFEAKFEVATAGNTIALNNILQKIEGSSWQQGTGFLEESGVEILLDNEKMALYDIEYPDMIRTLEKLFGTYTISEIKRFGEVKQVRFILPEENMEAKLNVSIAAGNGALYPIKNFMTASLIRDYKFITADKTGTYRSVVFNDEDADYELLLKKLTSLSLDEDFSVHFTGRYFNNQENIRQLVWILLISLLLLYFILVLQFENLIHPFLVMLTLPMGITGAFAALYMAGASLDVMAVMGLVIVLGLIVDDPILKVATINRLRKEYQASGMDKSLALEKALYQAGEVCLKPVMMTSLTTILALLPILFTEGIGSDLQKPLTYVIVGGLTIGTFCTVWFVPLAYWLVTRGKTLEAKKTKDEANKVEI